MDDQRFNVEAMRFTASVMGNPDYLAAVKSITPAKDERHVGLEKLNTYHASGKRLKDEQHA